MGRFTQANHGKPNMLRRMARGDWIIFYSPKTVYPDGDPLQAFTAIGQVADDEPYQAEMSPDFQPWRRNVDFLECTETPIRPLIEDLDFIEDKSRWGYKFRFGVFKIDEHDFEVIRSAMGANCAAMSNVDTAPTEVACAASPFVGVLHPREVPLGGPGDPGASPTTTAGLLCGHACGCSSPSYRGEHIAKWCEAHELAVECQLIDVAVQVPGQLIRVAGRCVLEQPLADD